MYHSANIAIFCVIVVIPSIPCCLIDSANSAESAESSKVNNSSAYFISAPAFVYFYEIKIYFKCLELFMYHCVWLFFRWIRKNAMFIFLNFFKL